MHKTGTVGKPSPPQPGVAEPQPKQVQSTPTSADARQNAAGPFIQQSASTPYPPQGQPYLQVPQGLPKHPSIPQGNPGQAIPWGGPPSQFPGGPGQMNNFVPPGPPAGINPGNNLSNPINKPHNPGNFVPSSTHPNGNVPGPIYNSPLMRSGNPSSSGIPGPGNSFPGMPGPGNSFSGIPGPGNSFSGIPGPGNSFPGSNSQMAGNNLNNTNNGAFRGSPPPSYQGNSFPGMAMATGGPNPYGYGPGPQGPGFQRPGAPTLPGPGSPKKKPGKRLPLWARITIGLLVFLVVITGGVFAYYETQVAPSLNNILGKQAIHHTTQSSSSSANQQQVTPTPPTGRTNILLLGSDTDGKGNDANSGTPLAQTVMIITIDPQSGYVGMLSIPRDMQVTDGYITPKLDEVFEHAYTGNSLQDKVATGAGAMEDVIQANFGIHIDHYAWVGLNGFVKVIDTAGGIDVDTIHPMVDDNYPDDVGNTNGSIYDYKRLYIAPGPQHLNGLQALDYVRTRHSDLIGDFGRTVRQQQIINQLKVKLDTPDTIGNATQLLQDLNGAVQTDMDLSSVIGLANIARNVDTNKIDRLTLGPPDYAVPSTGSSNYLPVCENIVPKIQQMFNITSPNCLPQAMSNTSSVARTTQPSTTVAFTTLSTSIASDSKQSTTSHGTIKANTMASTGVTSVDAGVHGLLDILFATTFDSFDAMQI